MGARADDKLPLRDWIMASSRADDDANVTVDDNGKPPDNFATIRRDYYFEESVCILLSLAETIVGGGQSTNIGDELMVAVHPNFSTI